MQHQNVFLKIDKKYLPHKLFHRSSSFIYQNHPYRTKCLFTTIFDKNKFHHKLLTNTSFDIASNLHLVNKQCSGKNYFFKTYQLVAMLQSLYYVIY
jgi:hypothetical protein